MNDLGNDWSKDVLVVCTDRGQHAPAKLRTVEFTPQRARLVRAVDPGRSDGERAEYLVGEGRKLTGTVEFRCPRCSRRPQIPVDALLRMAWELQRRGAARLDVSFVRRRTA